MSSKYDTTWLNNETTEIHSPKGRMLYPTLPPGEPRGMKGDDTSKPKFSCGLLLPKACNFDLLKNAIVECAKAKWGGEWQKKKLQFPLHKTVDHEKLAEYAEAFPMFLRTSANPDFAPFVYGPDAKPFTGQLSEIYSGRWAVIAMRIYPYPSQPAPQKKNGVGAGLQRIQLLDHDEPIAGGRVATASGFESASVGTGNSKVTNANEVFGTDDEIPF